MNLAADLAFDERLDFLRTERQAAIGVALRVLTAQLTHKGVSSGSGAMLAKERLAEEQVEAALAEMFASADRAKAARVADYHARSSIQTAVERLFSDLRTALHEEPRGAFGPNYPARPERLDAMQERAWSLVRQYWAGYLDTAPAGGPQYNVTVRDSPGAAVQQGGSGNTQTVMNLNIAAARDAAAALAHELEQMDPSAPAVGSALADVGSLRLQLDRAPPNPGLIQGIGGSLKAVLEGAAGGALSTGVIAAAQALWPLLGIGGG